MTIYHTDSAQYSVSLEINVLENITYKDLIEKKN